ncbi:28S ribosomal protein S31, mitochondrial [Drosophila obscura]|uniref:28S ribosomal protein S31, mitochondrial n=1 Tax=Drosophila obscura TaxID=7282 RepID=UPI001BB202FC|nr:28S ribosomal protein S31, mitochondrial [Drosophila obscura]
MLSLRSSQRLGLRSLLPAVYKNVGLGNNYSSSSQSKDDDGGYSSSDDEKPRKKAPKKPEETAAQRLNRLLGTMQATDQISTADFPRPGDANRRRKEALKQDAASKNVLTAAKNIASMLGTSESDKKQTESELLAKLLGHGPEAPPAVRGEAQASDTAASGGGAPEKELNLSELIVGMKIDRRPQPQQVEQTRGEYVRRTMASRSKHSDRYQQRPQRQTKREAESFTGSVNLFGGEPLGIFKEPLPISGDILATWSQLSERELSLHAAHPPANYFEQMALWTEQGKVWRFPIDNEQDWVDEVNVDFSEHIFLDQHLEDWCPSRGPIRHFMELVCVGLSKNPYVTAQEKKDHILWFRDYFEAKKDILKDLMDKEPSSKSKSISA